MEARGYASAVEHGSQIDRYIIEAELGRGGMAVVYRVRHATLDSTHALKILHTDQPVIAERLIQEGKLQASLRHPNVVAVTDVIDVNGAPGLVMEYVPDGALDELLDFDLAPEEGVRIFREICAGVGHAHGLGMIHRDLKPANVLIQKLGDRHIPKVADFGLAKVLGGNAVDGPKKTRSGVAMGTPAYMAPEQVRDAASVDEKADIWALGAILFELVQGERLFTGPGALEVMNAVVAGPDPKLLARIPPPIDAAVRGCVQPRLDKRIPDVATLLKVLDGESWQADEAGGTWFPGAADPAGETGELPFLPEHSRSSPSEGDMTWDPVETVPPPSAEPAKPEKGGGRSIEIAIPALPQVGSAAKWLALGVPVFLAFIGAFEAVDGMLQYPLIRAVNGELPTTDVVVVGIGETEEIRSLRQRHPAVIDALVDAGATAIVFDMTFRAQDEADVAFAAAVQRAANSGVPVVSATLFRDNAPLKPGTKVLAEALQGGIVRLETDLLFGTARKVRVRQGIIGDEDLWNVSVEAVSAHLGRNAEIRVEGDQLVVGGLRNSIWADLAVLHPTEDPLRIPYGTDVEEAKGRIAFIGLTSGPDDLHRTPDGPRYGVSILASFAQTLLRQSCLRMATQEQNALATMVAGIGTGLLATRLSRRAQPLALIVAAGVVAVSVALASAGIMVSILPTVLAGIIGLWAARKST